MIEKDADYRPDPTRAIYIDGLIDDQLFSRLTPQILRLQHDSRAPITVYIVNSPGGNVAAMQSILSTLRLRDQDSSEPCRIITVVTNKAQSAAADLLSSGDYAVAFPDSTLLYHGVRTPSIPAAFQPLTAERTSVLAHILRLTSDAYAMELAKKAEARFMLRFVLLRTGFQKIREEKPGISDLDCFVESLLSKLSRRAGLVFKKARERYKRYEPLHTKLDANAKKIGPETPGKMQARQLKAIVDFELANHKNDIDWTFKDGGLTNLIEDFYLMTEYIEGQQSERLRHWCLSLGRFSLSQDEQAELDSISDEQKKNEHLIAKVQPPVQPLWMFFVALCHALQEDDNELTATDAYWLGLVDEVMGNKSLLTPRMFVEYKPDPTPEEAPS